MTASILPNGKVQFEDINGAPLVSGMVAFYEVGTLTPKTTWQDQGETIPNANPLTLDERGQALIWGEGSYRQIVKDIGGNTIWDKVTSSATVSGFVPEGTQVGVNAEAIGAGSVANGAAATAVGYAATANGAFATAAGRGSVANADNATVFGYGAVSNDGAAFGHLANAHGLNATAFGSNSLADGYASTALGDTATAPAIGATAIGATSTANGVNATAIGTGVNVGFDYSSGIGVGAAPTASHQVWLGSPTETVNFSDANFYTAISGSDPYLNFDSTDYFTYTRSTNTGKLFVGGTEILHYSASIVQSNVRVGFVDANFYADISSTLAVLNFDTNDYALYDRTANAYQWYVGGTLYFEVAATAARSVGPFKTGSYIVSGLPSPSAGLRAFVTDALTPVFGSAVTGGGAVKVPVYSDGATWLVG